MLNVPRMAWEVASLAQDVRWLVGVAREAFATPPPSELEVELAKEDVCLSQSPTQKRFVLIFLVTLKKRGRK